MAGIDNKEMAANKSVHKPYVAEDIVLRQKYTWYSNSVALGKYQLHIGVTFLSLGCSDFKDHIYNTL